MIIVSNLLKENKKRSINKSIVVLLFFVFAVNYLNAQMSYGAAAIYGLNKVNPSYSGNAVQVRRACDNATVNIGFNTCGGLDTIALNAFAGLQNFPLNSITSPAATAFSLRKVNCSYSGSAIRIRSTAVGTPTFDIGFTSHGDLDTTSMKTAIGANSAYVTIWYDQSGNGRNATATLTGTNQPRIMLSGVIDRQGSRPAIRFLGGNTAGRGFATANLNIYGTAACFNGVVKINTDVTYNTFINQTNSNIPGPLDHYNGSIVVGNGATYSFYGPTQTLNSSYPNGIWTYQASGVTAANIKMWHNSTSILTTASNSSAYGGVNRPLYIGTRDDFVTSIDGWISEVVTFSALPSNTDRNFLEWTQAQYYGITTGVALGTLPSGTLPGAFVRTWYDQSGNNKNLVQNTNALQPRVVNTGVVDKQNNVPAIYFNGTTYFAEATLVCVRPYFATTIASRTGLPLGGSLGYARLLNLSSTGDSFGFLGTYGGGPAAGTPNFATFVGNGAGWNDIAANLTLTSVAASPHIMSMSVQTGAGNLIPYINGTAQTGKDGTSSSSTGFIYGGAWNGSNVSQLWTGYSYGLQIFTSAISQTRRILLESNQAAFNNITISGGKYTPPTTTTYNKFVTGIGRVSSSDTVLGTRSTVGLGIKSSTVAGTDFLQSNGDYLVCGINCSLGPGTAVSNLPATVLQRWSNDWYINKTDVGTAGGKVTLYFDFSDYGYTGGFSPGIAANYELLQRSTSAGTFSIVTGTTKTVNGDRVEFDLDANGINNNYYYTIGTINTSSSPLPIELLNFNAIANHKTVDILWSTATEINNDYFTIEKSKNGIDFSSLKTVQSKALNGNSLYQLNYAEVDENPYLGTSYYRLKQVDFNGSIHYSSVVDVTFIDKINVDILVFPNPSEGEFTLNFTGINTERNASILIFDALGNKVYNNSIKVEPNNNSFQIVSEEKIAQGFYFLTCFIDGVTITRKIVIQ